MKKSLLLLIVICSLLFANYTFAQWTLQTSPTTAQLNSICFVDANHGWAVGNLGNIIATTNGGTTWASQGAGSTTEDLYSVSFYDINNGWVVGNNGALLQTTNGGMSWDVLNFGVDPYTNPLYSVQFTGSTNGWVAGGDTLTPSGDFFLSTGSSQWTQGSFNGITPLQIFSFNPNNAWTLVTDGQGSFYTYNTTTGIQGWSNQKYLALNRVCSIYMLSMNSGWICGNGGFLNYNGSNWSTVSTALDSITFNFLVFKDASNGWAVGSGGNILKYDGSNWTAQTSNTTNNLRSVCFTDVNNGWAVGQFGTILHTKNGGKPGSGGINEIHKSVSNAHTYPNPCIDNAVLSYQLSENSFVNIKLFDIAGKEISTLTNEQKAKGDYRLKIDASNLKSGIYFCKIQAGQYSESTKLTIIK
jgi:photosystem II stability/assembly factor-like uncharacterized protein